ncbi:unnamed protein product [Brassica rapa]|uniref:Uncharacterized protein n=2 Tax=Brassica TaxID=3705 RepID=A0A3P5YN04_BRACM|nr:unnamed protein product [Brassica napus]CAG7864976.1 unnamed protein product [Brassica rapa]CDY21355.1 BnaA09g30720D [Brassica napus]VDC62111.1 unnamed protein product [Brassica rapa]
MEPPHRSQRRRNNITGTHQIGQTESKSDNRSHRTRQKAKPKYLCIINRQPMLQHRFSEGDSTEEVEKAEDDTIREKPEVKPPSSPKLQVRRRSQVLAAIGKKDAPPEPSASGHRRDRYAARAKTRQPILRKPSGCRKRAPETTVET